MGVGAFHSACVGNYDVVSVDFVSSFHGFYNSSFAGKYRSARRSCKVDSFMKLPSAGYGALTFSVVVRMLFSSGMDIPGFKKYARSAGLNLSPGIK